MGRKVEPGCQPRPLGIFPGMSREGSNKKAAKECNRELQWVLQEDDSVPGIRMAVAGKGLEIPISIWTKYVIGRDRAAVGTYMTGSF